MLKGKLRWFFPALWGVLIIVLSLLPGGVGNMQFLGIPHVDKIGHFGMYAIWAYFIFNAFSGNENVKLRKVFWMTIFTGTIAGVLLEFGQYAMTMGRSFEIGDMIANGVGSVAGSLVGMFLLLKNT